MPRKKATTSAPARKKRKAREPSTEIAYRYACDTAGARFAPRWIKHQCADFVSMLDKKTAPYSEDAVKHAVWFMHGLPVPLGNFGKSGRIELAPPQMYWAAELYGRRDPDDPTRRRYTEMYLVVPRKAGKSTFGAAMCLLDICDPNRNGPLAQCAGRTKEHSWHVYDRAKKMVNASESLRNTYALSASDRQIKRNDASNALMKCEPGNLKDGSHPTIATFDELHDTDNAAPIEVLRSSFGATRDPMLAKFTTAGHLPVSLGLEERELAIQNFRDTISLPNHLNLLYEWDSDLGDELDDGDPRLWEAIHPMYHHTIEPNFYSNAYQKGRVNDRSRSEFNHKLLCKWMRGDQDMVITEDAWDALPKAPPLKGAPIRRAWVGIDSADYHDLTSLTLVGQLDDGSLCAWWRIMAPAAKLEDSKTLAQWHRQGWLEVCGAKRTDYERVANILTNWVRNYPVELMAIDQHSSRNKIFFALPDPVKAKLVLHQKWAAKYTPPTQELITLVQDKGLRVDKNPVARWGVCNAVMDAKVSGTMLPKKIAPHSPHKIDPLDSLIQALAAMLECQMGKAKANKNAPIMIRDIGYGGRLQVL